MKTATGLHSHKETATVPIIVVTKIAPLKKKQHKQVKEGETEDKEGNAAKHSNKMSHKGTRMRQSHLSTLHTMHVRGVDVTSID